MVLGKHVRCPAGISGIDFSIRLFIHARFFARWPAPGRRTAAPRILARAFLSEAQTDNVLYDVALKIPALAESGLLTDAKRLLAHLYDIVLPSGSVDFAHRQDAPTFNPLFTIECSQYFDLADCGDPIVIKHGRLLDDCNAAEYSHESFAR